MKETNEVKQLKAVERLLVKAEKLIAAMDVPTRTLVTGYCNVKYGWFVRETAEAKENVQ
jgi:hypothetical protein